MILFTAKAIKLSALLLCALGGLWCLKKSGIIKPAASEESRSDRLRRPAGWVVLVVVFALVANMAGGGLVPPVRDTVVLTALGKANEISDGTEVFFRGFTVDDKAYPAEQPTEGKWFWWGDDMLCWRIETDPHQPDGVTRSITVEAPVGWDRTVDFFSGDIYRGMVQIESVQGSQILDTYAPEIQTISASLGRSNTSLLIWNQVRMLAVYCAVLLVLTALALKLILWIIKEPEAAKAWYSRNSSKLVYGAIVLVTLALMLLYADKESLREDEFFQIYAASDTWAGMFGFLIRNDRAMGPVPYILNALWYRFAPYGQTWLLLASIVYVVAATYMIGLTGELVKNKRAGVLASVICASATLIWLGAAYEFRTYAQFVLFSALSLYSFVKRNLEPQRVKWHVLYSFALLCMGMTHICGMFVCAVYFLGDLYLFVKKKIIWKTGLDYVVPGGICLAWLLYRIAGGMLSWVNGINAWWSPSPNITSIIGMLRELVGGTSVLYFVLILGMCVGILGPVVKKNKIFDWQQFYQSFFAWSTVFVFGVMTFYGTVIKSSGFMFQSRYFLGLVPSIAVLMGAVGSDILDTLFAAFPRKEHGLLGYISICLVLYLNCVSAVSQSQGELYRKAADYIYSDIVYVYDDDAFVVECSSEQAVFDGWNLYYLAEQGKREEMNGKCQYLVTEEELLNYNRIYVVHCFSDVRPEMQEWLNRSYDLVADNMAVGVRIYTRKPQE